MRAPIPAGVKSVSGCTAPPSLSAETIMLTVKVRLAYQPVGPMLSGAQTLQYQFGHFINDLIGIKGTAV